MPSSNHRDFLIGYKVIILQQKLFKPFFTTLLDTWSIMAATYLGKGVKSEGKKAMISDYGKNKLLVSCCCQQPTGSFYNTKDSTNVNKNIKV